MVASWLDGKKAAQDIKARVSDGVKQYQAKNGRAPGLAVVLVGHDPASQIYVERKRQACTEVGIASFAYDFAETVSEQELLDTIHTLNADPLVDGILIQLPLPSHIAVPKVIRAISPDKDVDGFHPLNMGLLIEKTPALRPCTPYGIIALLDFYDVPISGKHAVVVGASNIVGRPMACEFLLKGATVTICHHLTQHLEKHVRMADIVVSAVGKQGIISSEWLHDTQVVIDVGIHRNAQGLLSGDIDIEMARTKVGWITPVPGGVGPMTVAMLLHNTLHAAELGA